MEEVAGRADFNFRSLRGDGAGEKIVTQSLKKYLFPVWAPCGKRAHIDRDPPFSLCRREGCDIQLVRSRFVGDIGTEAAVGGKRVVINFGLIGGGLHNRDWRSISGDGHDPK